ncbi:MAG: methylenetetrahydrofolate reductase [Pyrobaculum sp.]|nr:methylenetetrahydrofolate reductase [Pyrobaculum sp.]
MEIIAEVTPVRDRERLLKKLEALKPLVNKIDIPEAPGGKPTAHALAVGVLAKQMGLEPIVHIRLLDVNKTGLKSLLGGAYLLDIREVVVLQGDPPAEGRPVGDVSTEEAVTGAKKIGLKVGALLSLKRDYKRRIETLGADFYLALHLTDVRQLEGLPPVVYPYVMVKTSNNSALIERLKQTAVNPQKALELIRALEGVAPGVVVSVPGDFDTLLNLLNQIKKS